MRVRKRGQVLQSSKPLATESYGPPSTTRICRRPVPRHIAEGQARNIFTGDEDRLAWREIVAAVCERFNWVCGSPTICTICECGEYRRIGRDVPESRAPAASTDRVGPEGRPRGFERAGTAGHGDR